MPGVEFRLLGPVSARVGGERVDVGVRRQRLVLAVLALEVNRVVTVAELVDLAWPGEPPPSAVHAIRVCVSGLRSALTRAGVPPEQARLSRQGSGYVLRTEESRVDAHRFRALLAQARQAADDRKVALLDEALGLWSGPALADVAPEQVRQRLAAGLEEARLVAVEERIDATIALGRHREVLDELTGLVERNPLRERLVGQLMLALHRDGRSGEALAVYRGARARLAGELGIDPGEELRRLESAILREDPALAAPRPRSTVPPAAGAVPAQLPAADPWFTGREAALGRLDALLGPDGPTATVAVVSGAAGVGKTALAVHWATRHRQDFPDGQLFVNLHGYAPGRPMRPARVLAAFLRALGVPAEQVPLDTAEASALYRTRMADRRMLVVLDNAAGPEQVRPLLAGARHCLTVVTSRARLAGLAVRDGASLVDLDVLTPADAHALVTRVLGPGRVAAEPAEAAELADLCGLLPLALRIAAANLAGHPGRSIASHVAELRDGNRLALLAVDGDERAAVRAAFDQSYAALPAEARRVFRLIGLAPGPDLGLAAATALAGTGRERVRQALDRLLGLHLVGEPVPGRFGLHDLLRLYARARCQAEEPESERAAALARLHDYQLRSADAAARVLYPQMQRLPPAGPPDRAATGVEAEAFTDPAAAVAWLDAERHTLVATARAAAADGPPQVAWQLADALRGYFWMRRHTSDWMAVGLAGLAAAKASDAPDGLAAAHLCLAQAYRWLGRHDTALVHFTEARTQAGRAGWRQGEAAALGTMANVYRDAGRLADAAWHHRRAGEIYRQTGGTGGEAVSLGNLGNVLLELGRLAEAVQHFDRALALYQRMGAGNGEAHVRTSLGAAYRAMGRPDTARRHLDVALSLHRDAGSREGEADALTGMAEVEADAGNHAEAGRLARAAVALADAAGDRRLAADGYTALAAIAQQLGEFGAARDHATQALRLVTDIGYRRGRAVALTCLAGAHLGLGAFAEALDAAGAAVALAREAGFRLFEADALTVLALAELGHGRPAAARGHARAALAIFRRAGCRPGEARALRALGEVDRRAGVPPLPAVAPEGSGLPA